MPVYRKAGWVVGLAMVMAGGGCAERVAQPGPSDPVAELGAAEASRLRSEVAGQAETIAQLHAEIAQLGERERALTNSLKQAIRKRTGQAPMRLDKPEVSGEAEAARAAELTAVRQELSAERRRRADLEEELSRLKSETSGSAFSRGAASDDTAQLRDDLDRERAMHQRLLAELKALQEESPLAKHPRRLDGGGMSADVRALRARLLDLETRHQEVMSSVARTMAADRKREQDLLAQLAAAQGAAPAPAPVPVAAAVPGASDADLRHAKQENERLRAMLDDERERNARLAAKLKLAGRVTDLIFKMKQQAGEPAPAPPQATESGPP